MTAKEAAVCIKNRTFVKIYDAALDQVISCQYIEKLNVFLGRHKNDVGEDLRVITTATLKMNSSCSVTCELRNVYPWDTPAEDIRKAYQNTIDHTARLQGAGLYTKCPRCGDALSEQITDRVESRRDDRLQICPRCGKAEAFCDENDVPDLITDWYIFRTPEAEG